MDVHPLSRLMLVHPPRVQARLDELARAGVVDTVPNLWQVTLGALRMWHRMLFRPETIGNCADHPVRRSWRARLLEVRGLRIPVLLAARAIAPWDLSGLYSSKARVHRHLLRAHHEQNQFVYDLEMPADDRAALEAIRDEAQAVVEGRHPQARWLRDLVVYEGYHEDLVAALEGALRGEAELPADEADDPDISFLGFLRWCAAQPATPDATRAAWLEGRYTWSDGLVQAPAGALHLRASSPAARQLQTLGLSELHRVMREGGPVDPQRIRDSEWRGVSLGLPELADKVAWKVFIKVFAGAEGARADRLRGWNVRVVQGEADRRPRPKRRRGGPHTFGHFEVRPAHGYAIPGGGGQGLMLDYGRGGNLRLDPVSRLRDPIIAPDPANPDLLLGWSYLDLAGRQVPTPSFFTLERLGPRTHDARPPRT